MIPASWMIVGFPSTWGPRAAWAVLYAGLWYVLSGRARRERYNVLSDADRQAIVEILRETKPDLPEYFVMS